jgi:hypothetical protein
MATRAELHQNIKWAKNFKPITSREAAKIREMGKEVAKNWGPRFGPVV